MAISDGVEPSHLSQAMAPVSALPPKSEQDHDDWLMSAIEGTDPEVKALIMSQAENQDPKNCKYFSAVASSSSELFVLQAVSRQPMDLRTRMRWTMRKQLFPTARGSPTKDETKAPLSATMNLKNDGCGAKLLRQTNASALIAHHSE